MSTPIFYKQTGKCSYRQAAGRRFRYVFCQLSAAGLGTNRVHGGGCAQAHTMAQWHGGSLSEPRARVKRPRSRRMRPATHDVVQRLHTSAHWENHAYATIIQPTPEELYSSSEMLFMTDLARASESYMCSCVFITRGCISLYNITYIYM